MMEGSKDTELFFVTREFKGLSYNKLMTSLESKKELQSELTRCNSITSIKRATLTEGEEVDIEEIKPKKYKGKPWTYKEKYGDE